MKAAVALVLLACLLAPPARAEESIVEIAYTTCSKIYGTRTMLIRSEEELKFAWLDLGMGPPPEVDFGSCEVVVHFAGARPAQGYQLFFAYAGVDDGVLRVDLDETMPVVRPDFECEAPEPPSFPAIAFLVSSGYRDVQVVTSSRMSW